jgi:hypothetical protein
VISEVGDKTYTSAEATVLLATLGKQYQFDKRTFISALLGLFCSLSRAAFFSLC